MANENTVTIPIEEYFELRKQSEMNVFLLGEVRMNDNRFMEFNDRLIRLEDEVRRLSNGK